MSLNRLAARSQSVTNRSPFDRHRVDPEARRELA